jgi:hypothetical protein
MPFIEVTASKITGIFFQTTNSKAGQKRIERYYDYYGYLEGLPVIEQITKDTYRLITIQENFVYYKNFPETKFNAALKTFACDTDRYLELLKQLFDGKAMSYFNDKHLIIQKLLLSLSEREISKKINIPVSEIRRFIFKKDQYKIYLEKSFELGVRTTMQSAVNFLRKSTFIKEESQVYILHFVLYGQDGLFRLTNHKWDILKTILEGIYEKFDVLTAKNQKRLIYEIVRDGWTVLIDYFNKRCDDLREV